MSALKTETGATVAAASDATPETFGNIAPWAEPAWCNSLKSPYYNDTHRRLRDTIRNYVDSNILPNNMQWEEDGGAPRDEALKWAKTGIPFVSMDSMFHLMSNKVLKI